MTSHLESLVSGYKVGRNLFAGTWPMDAPDSAVVIYETAGSRMDPNIPHESDVYLQIRSRGKTYFTAESVCASFFYALVSRTNIGVRISRGASSWWLHGPSGAVAPQHLGQDALGRFEFSAQLTLKVRTET